MKLFAALVLAFTALLARAEDKVTYPTFGTIERFDPRLDKLIPKDAKIEKLAEGLKWAEGPLWIKDGGFLICSDVPQNTIFKWKEGDTKLSEYMKPSGYTGDIPRGGEPGSNGLTLDASGRLILCEHGDRRIARVEKDGKKKTLADKFDGKRFNSPNDVCVKSNGDIYFTDPPYGLIKNWDDPAREQEFCGVYRISEKDGSVTVLTKELVRPNGLAFSPDEKILYVAQSDGQKPIIMAFEVKDDGTLGAGKLFFDAKPLQKPGVKGSPDGMKVDKDGNLFATGPGGVLIIAPDGTHLGTIATDVATANCNWGEDGTVLYICADHAIARVKTTTKGNRY
jgi:gluconolactonase